MSYNCLEQNNVYLTVLTIATGTRSKGVTGSPLLSKHSIMSLTKGTDEEALGGGATTPPNVRSSVFVRLIFFLLIIKIIYN